MNVSPENQTGTRTLSIGRTSHLATQLGVAEQHLKDLASRASQDYIDFTRIVKGKQRRLVMAKPELAEVQKRILERLLMRLPPSEAAYGAIKGRSVKQNAAVHAASAFVAKLDIRAFYPNIHRKEVYQFFISQECPPDVSRLLTLLTTHKHALPLGASTSPMLADQIVRPIDIRLETMARQASLNYTRYVDDIAISGSYPLERFTKLVLRILEQYGFKVRPRKLIIYRPGDQKERIITGVRISDGKVFAPLGFVAQLESDLRAAARQSRHSVLEGFFYSRQHYRGRIAYVQWLDADAGSGLVKLYRKVKWQHLEWMMREAAPQPHRHTSEGNPT